MCWFAGRSGGGLVLPCPQASSVRPIAWVLLQTAVLVVNLRCTWILLPWFTLGVGLADMAFEGLRGAFGCVNVALTQTTGRHRSALK